MDLRYCQPVQSVHEPVQCILPSNAPTDADLTYFEPSPHERNVLHERCGNRRDQSEDPQLRKRVYTLFEQTQPRFIVNVQQHRFKALDKPLHAIIKDSRKLWQQLWEEKNTLAFRQYRQRQPRDMEGLDSSGDKDGKTWPDHLELAFVRGILLIK
jgi:hypothetical protein